MNSKIKPDLRISGQGVVFDPSTGESFTVNDTGLEILRSLIDGLKENEIFDRISENYELTRTEFDRNLLDFISVLKSHHLLAHEG